MNLLPYLMTPGTCESLVVNSGAFSLFIASGKAQKMLTQEGIAHAYALGVLLWATLGWRGWVLCASYLLAGSAATCVKIAEKAAKGIAEARGGARGPENVWGSALAGALCAASTMVWPRQTPLLRIAFVASFATKLSDTMASEIGKAYGKTTYLATTFKLVPAGTEGAVSAEGTAAGVVGSLIMAGMGAAMGLMPVAAIPICAVAAFAANYVESLIGATVQGKVSWLTNEVVNFINTGVGAGIAAVLSLRFLA